MPGPMRPTLEIRNLKKTYDGKNLVLKGINLSIAKGEFVAVVGSSGAGKSTLIRCINKLVAPTSGEVIFDGQAISGVKGRNLKAIRAKMGMIFQHYNLIARTNVLNNVLHGRLGETPFYKSILGLYKKDDKAEAEALIHSVGLSDQMYQKAGTLSGGQMQRVGICRALMQHPKLLLADEPIASLDPAASNTVLSLMLDAATERGIACIVNLHQVDFAKKYATRIIGMKHGEIVFDGSPHQLDDSMIAYIYSDDDSPHGGDSNDASDVLTSSKEFAGNDNALQKISSATRGNTDAKLFQYNQASNVSIACHAPALTHIAKTQQSRHNKFFGTAKKIAPSTTAFAVLIFAFIYLQVNPLNVFASFPNFAYFLYNNFLPPNFDGVTTHFPTVRRTLLFAIVSTYISAFMAFFFGILMSRALSPLSAIRVVTRFFVSFLRNVPLLVWGTVLVFIFGIGSMLGVVTLVLATVGFLARSYADSIDEIAGTKLEAIRVSGAGYLQVLFHGLVPEFIPSWVNWTLFSFEINIRASAVLGMVGAGGLGLLIQTNLELRSYRRAMALILILVVMVLIAEILVGLVRRFIEWQKTAQMKWQPLTKKLFQLLVAVMLAALFFVSAYFLEINIAQTISRVQANATRVIPQLIAFNPSFLPEIFGQLFVSILIGICALALGALVSVVFAFLGASNTTPFAPIGWFIKAAVSILRAIPSLVLILMVVASLGFGATTAIVGLMFSSVGYLTKAFIASIEEQDPGIIETMRALGASKFQIIVHGIFPGVITSFIAWVSIRLEGNVADSVSIGIVGAGGVGLLIARATRQLNFANLTTVIVVIFATMLVVEFVAGALRRKLAA